jgi:hypothetical protein
MRTNPLFATIVEFEKAADLLSRRLALPDDYLAAKRTASATAAGKASAAAKNRWQGASVKHLGRPNFSWPDDLAEFDSTRYPSDWTPLRKELRWHLDRCTAAARAGRKDIAMDELVLGTPSLRRKGAGSGDAGPVVIVEPPK